MITTNYTNTPNIQEVMVGFSSRGHEWKVAVGALGKDHTFIKDQTILVPKDSPKVLWNILHEFAGVPYPKIESDPRKEPAKMDFPVKNPGTQEKVPTVPSVIISKQVDVLEALSAREIINKVKQDTGILITIGTKSKARILKRAHEIYSQKA